MGVKGRPKKKKPPMYTYRVKYDVVGTAEGTVYITLENDGEWDMQDPSDPPADLIYRLREIIEQNAEGDQKICTDNRYGGISYHEVEDGNITPDYEDAQDEWTYFPSNVEIKDFEDVTDKLERRTQSEPFVTRMEVYHPLNHKLDDSYCYTIKVGSNTVRIWAEPNQHTRTEIEGSAGLNSSVVNNIIDAIACGQFELKDSNDPQAQSGDITHEEMKTDIRRLYNGIL